MKEVRLFLIFILSAFFLSALSQKQFELFDAMPYIGKPDLSSECLSPIYLMYESTLTKQDTAGRYKVVLDSTKLEKQAFVASLFPSVVVSTDIEEWYGNRNVDASTMKAWYQKVFESFKIKNKNVIVGNYGLPIANLNLRRFNRIATEEEVIDEWKRASAKRMHSGSINDYLSPSFYIATPDTTQWLIDLEISTKYLREHFPDKKIYAYIWPQYYDFKDSPYFKTFMSPEIWETILNGCYKYLDGAIIWSSVFDENHNYIHWKEKRVQEIWDITKKFIVDKNIKPVADFYNSSTKTFIYKSNNFKVFTAKSIDTTTYTYRKGFSEISLKPNNKNTKNKSETLKLILYNPSANNINNEYDKIKNFILKDLSNSSKNRYDSYKLGFLNTANKGISEYRNSNSNFFINIGSWIQNTDFRGWEIEMENADFIVSRCLIVDDDTTSWEKEFFVTIKELKRRSPGKPIYALINTHYLNNQEKVKTTTLNVAIELSKKLCDGLIMIEDNNIIQ